VHAHLARVYRSTTLHAHARARRSCSARVACTWRTRCSMCRLNAVPRRLSDKCTTRASVTERCLVTHRLRTRAFTTALSVGNLTGVARWRRPSLGHPHDDTERASRLLDEVSPGSAPSIVGSRFPTATLVQVLSIPSYYASSSFHPTTGAELNLLLHARHELSKMFRLWRCSRIETSCLP